MFGISLADVQRRIERQAGIERRLGAADRMRDDRQIDGAVLRLDLIDPDFRIVVGVPARRHVLRAAGGVTNMPSTPSALQSFAVSTVSAVVIAQVPAMIGSLP